MSKEIDINDEEEILKECDFDYYYNSVCSRELCMFFNDIARQDSHFDKRQAYIDLGRIAIVLNKSFSEVAILGKALELACLSLRGKCDYCKYKDDEKCPPDHHCSNLVMDYFLEQAKEMKSE